MDILYPRVCPFCGRIVKSGTCDDCRDRVEYVQEPKCKRCGKPIESMEAEYCYDCQKGRHFFEEGQSLYVHKSPVSEAVYAMKYQNKRVYALSFGEELAKKYGDFLYKRGVDIIVPIPLSSDKRRKRGFNQAEILAKELSNQTGIPLETGILKRKKSTVAQKKLSKKERQRNMVGAFIARRDFLHGEGVVLVDDIYTTGSTIDEAARMLKKGGAGKVYFLTISIGQGY